MPIVAMIDNSMPSPERDQCAHCGREADPPESSTGGCLVEHAQQHVQITKSAEMIRTAWLACEDWKARRVAPHAVNTVAGMFRVALEFRSCSTHRPAAQQAPG